MKEPSIYNLIFNFTYNYSLTACMPVLTVRLVAGMCLAMPSMCEDLRGAIAVRVCMQNGGWKLVAKACFIADTEEGLRL